METKQRVVIADDHDIYREGLRTVLARNPELVVVGEAGDGQEAVTKVQALRPDLVIMDIAMPRLNGLQATREIMAALPETRIIILSVHSRRTFILEALAAGARGYVLKDSAGEKLLEAVAAVLRRECYLDSPVAGHIFDEFVKQPSPGLAQSAPPSVLTLREVEILRLVVDGLSSKDIAVKLFLSPKTVENHRSNIMAKLGLHDVIDLVKYALANGLVDPETWSR